MIDQQGHRPLLRHLTEVADASIWPLCRLFCRLFCHLSCFFWAVVAYKLPLPIPLQTPLPTPLPTLLPTLLPTPLPIPLPLLPLRLPEAVRTSVCLLSCQLVYPSLLSWTTCRPGLPAFLLRHLLQFGPLRLQAQAQRPLTHLHPLLAHPLLAHPHFNPPGDPNQEEQTYAHTLSHTATLPNSSDSIS